MYWDLPQISVLLFLFLFLWPFIALVVLSLFFAALCGGAHDYQVPWHLVRVFSMSGHGCLSMCCFSSCRLSDGASVLL